MKRGINNLLPVSHIRGQGKATYILFEKVPECIRQFTKIDSISSTSCLHLQLLFPFMRYKLCPQLFAMCVDTKEGIMRLEEMTIGSRTYKRLNCERIEIQISSGLVNGIQYSMTGPLRRLTSVSGCGAHYKPTVLYPQDRSCLD